MPVVCRARVLGYSLLLVSILHVGSVAAQECSEDVLCLHAVEDGLGMHIDIENRGVGTVSFRLDLALENARASAALPVVARISGRKRVRLLTLTPKDEYRSWGYRSSLEWIYGDLRARHDDAHTYALPFAPGQDVLVGQGYDGDFSHRDRYAIDFNLPEGTPILAARDGMVVDLKDSYWRGGADLALRKSANFIAIQHADGTVGQYAHLMRGGARVQVGQRVRTGQVIGLSGNTGYTTGPHLHFEVFRIAPDLTRQSIPVQFRTSEARRTTLQTGQFYRH